MLCVLFLDRTLRGGPGLKNQLLQTKPERTGRDEMNLAEFALGLASDRNSKDVKTLERKQTVVLSNGTKLDQVWVVTGSDKHGLPRAGDDDILLALLKLASDQGFQDRQVFFTRYEVMQILDLVPNGRNYERFEAGLDRLAGVRILAKNSFWDNSRKSYMSLNFGLIDDYVIADRPLQKNGQLEMPLTHVSFNEKFFHSMQIGNVKRLDMTLYNSLKSAMSKRLYRYLDKRRYRNQIFDVDIYTLATVNLGLDISNRRYASQIKQLLDRAQTELQKHGFLQDWTYRWSEDRGTWFVRYRFAKQQQSVALEPDRTDPDPEPCPAQKELLLRGLSSKMAARLAQNYPERVAQKIDMYDHLVRTSSPLLSRNPLGWLRKAIEDDYGQVPGYEPPEIRKQKLLRAQAVASQKQAEETHCREQLDDCWERYLALPENERQSLLSTAKGELRFLSADKLKLITEDSPLIRATILALMAEDVVMK